MELQMKSENSYGLNIKYEIKEFVRTIDFYNILLGKEALELFDRHAIYSIQDLRLHLTFIQNPAIDTPLYGTFALQLDTDEEVYERFNLFSRNSFLHTVKIDPQKFTAKNHSFRLNDPNGLTWDITNKEKKPHPFYLFNIPPMKSSWDILKL